MKTTKELIIADITAKVEAKLASHKVNLAIPDQLISIIKNSKTLDNKFDELQKLYVKYNVEGNILLKETKSDLIKLEQEDARISKLVKDLGLNPSDLPYLKDSGNAYSVLAKIVNMLESGLKK
jgi:hypothetical protein